MLDVGLDVKNQYFEQTFVSSRLGEHIQEFSDKTKFSVN